MFQPWWNGPNGVGILVVACFVVVLFQMMCYGWLLWVVSVVSVVAGMISVCCSCDARGGRKTRGRHHQQGPPKRHSNLHTIALSNGSDCIDSDACGAFPTPKLTVLATTDNRLLLLHAISRLTATGSRSSN